MHKTNVLTFAGDLWQRTFNEVAAEYPDVDTGYNHVDAACIYFVAVDPQRYDVIVTDNLFGDILTDLGGAVSGGIGFASSANLNPARTGPSMFEPVHGSAPDIAGTGKANPDRRHPERGDDARVPRRGRRRRPHPQGVRGSDVRLDRIAPQVQRRDRRRDRRTRVGARARCPSRPPRRSG